MDRWLSGVKGKAVIESISTSEEGQNEKTKQKERLVESIQVSTYRSDLRVSDQMTAHCLSVCCGGAVK